MHLKISIFFIYMPAELEKNLKLYLYEPSINIVIVDKTIKDNWIDVELDSNWLATCMAH